MTLLLAVVVATFLNHKEVVVKTEVVEGMSFFRVRVAKQERPLWFVVDSGASYDVIDTRAATALGLRPTSSGTVGGAGSGRVPAQIVQGVTFTMPGLTTSGHEVRVIDLRGIEEMLGHPIDGILGYPFLMQVVTTIDAKKHEVRFREPERFRKPRGDVLPIRFGKNGRWIYVPVTVKVPGVPPETADYFVDSGSGDGANTPLIRRSTAPLREIQTGNGIGNPTSGVAGSLEWIRLGTRELRDVSSSCCAPTEGIERQIGQAVLSKFVVTFDYPHRRMILQ